MRPPYYLAKTVGTETFKFIPYPQLIPEIASRPGSITANCSSDSTAMPRGASKSSPLPGAGIGNDGALTTEGVNTYHRIETKIYHHQIAIGLYGDP